MAIADGDEWDDQPRQKPGNMNTFLATKPINVAGLNANSVLLKFDSSWRPESPQKAVIRVAFDGGAASEGGFPIVIDGKLIGAIGASGGIATQDGVTAKAGLAALEVLEAAYRSFEDKRMVTVR